MSSNTYVRSTSSISTGSMDTARVTVPPERNWTVRSVSPTEVTMARWALIRRDTGVVDNVVEWDGDPSRWQPPSTHDAVRSDTAGIGDTYDPASGVFAPGPRSRIEIEAETRATLLTLVSQALTVLQAIIDTPPPTITSVAQAQTAIRALQVQVKDEARVLRRLVRLVAGLLDGTD